MPGTLCAIGPFAGANPTQPIPHNKALAVSCGPLTDLMRRTEAGGLFR